VQTRLKMVNFMKNAVSMAIILFHYFNTSLKMLIRTKLTIFQIISKRSILYKLLTNKVMKR